MLTLHTLFPVVYGIFWYLSYPDKVNKYFWCGATTIAVIFILEVVNAIILMNAVVKIYRKFYLLEFDINLKAMYLLVTAYLIYVLTMVLMFCDFEVAKLSGTAFFIFYLLWLFSFFSTQLILIYIFFQLCYNAVSLPTVCIAKRMTEPKNNPKSPKQTILVAARNSDISLNSSS